MEAKQRASDRVVMPSFHQAFGCGGIYVVRRITSCWPGRYGIRMDQDGKMFRRPISSMLGPAALTNMHSGGSLAAVFCQFN